MIREAIRGRLPLIYAYGSDPINDRAILESLLESEGIEYDEDLLDMPTISDGMLESSLSQGYTVLIADHQTVNINVSAIYNAAAEGGASFIILYNNGEEPGHVVKSSFFNAGKVLPDDTAALSVLQHYYPEATVKDALQYYRGLTLNEIVTVASMSISLHGNCTFSSVLRTRRQLMGETPGLELVDTAMGFYVPEASLASYCNRACKLFDTDLVEFRPRGILLTGKPGTGKTEASKYLANRLDVPLFRLDIGAMMTKWQGESESNLKNALQVASRSEPCVLLLDEVEKVISSDSDSGGSVYRMLSQLLWWLQSHKNKIMTVMTCNNINILPPELYRQGRIDQVMEFYGLTGNDAGDFAEAVLKHYTDSTGLELSPESDEALHDLTFKWSGENMTLSQSEITQEVKELLIASNF